MKETIEIKLLIGVLEMMMAGVNGLDSKEPGCKLGLKEAFGQTIQFLKNFERSDD